MLRKEEASPEAKQKVFLKATNDLNNLVLRFTSSENKNEELLTTAEYQALKGKILKQKSAIEDELRVQGSSIEDWVEVCEKTFNFARYARIWFANGSIDTKRAIFSCLGSNPLPHMQKIALIIKKPLKAVAEKRDGAEEELKRFEPLNIPVNASTIGKIREEFPLMGG